MSRLSSVFLPTINLDNPAVLGAVQAEGLPVRVGQWVQLNGRRGQFLTARNSTVYVAWNAPNQTFEERTQRFARAVWHQSKKDMPATTAVLKAPRTLTLQQVKEFFARQFATA